MVEWSTALLSVVLFPPPRLMFATAFFPAALAVTQSMPAMIPEVDPDPEFERTFTATRLTFFATPYFAPPTMPATCVPCPLPWAAGVSAGFDPHAGRPPD